jgi:hypothetical protein
MENLEYKLNEIVYVDGICTQLCTSNFEKIWKPPKAVFETKLFFKFWFVVLFKQKTHKQIFLIFY